MKKRLGALLLCLCMVIGLLPITASALTDSYYFKSGTSQGSAKDAVYWNGSTQTLTLRNASITRTKDGSEELTGIQFDCDATIVLIGSNSITVNDAGNDIYGAINMNGHALTITGSSEDGYMGTLKLETKTATYDNAVIYNFDGLTVTNVKYLSIIAGYASNGKSSYGLWSLGKHHNLTFTNSCVEISAISAANYGYAINNYNSNTKSREMDIYLNNSSVTMKSKSGTVVRDKKWSGDVYVNSTKASNSGNPKTPFTDPKTAYVNYHYTKSDETAAISNTSRTVPSTGDFGTISYTVPEREGYEFIGWSTAEDGSGTSYQNGDAAPNLLVLTNNTLNLYAQYVKKPTLDEETVINLLKVMVTCTTENKTETYDLESGCFTIGAVQGTKDIGYTCTVTMNPTAENTYTDKFVTTHGTHEKDSTKSAVTSFTFKWNSTQSKWELEDNTYVQYYMKCTPATPTPTPTPTPSGSATPTPTPTPTPSGSATPTPTPTPTPSGSTAPTPTPTPTPSGSTEPTPTPTPTPSGSTEPTPTPTPTPSGSTAPTPTPTPTPTPSGSATPTPTPTPTPSGSTAPTPTRSPETTPSDSTAPTPTRSPETTPSDSTAPTPTRSPETTPSDSTAPTPTQGTVYKPDYNHDKSTPAPCVQDKWNENISPKTDDTVSIAALYVIALMAVATVVVSIRKIRE